jgi:hypothetical protein
MEGSFPRSEAGELPVVPRLMRAYVPPLLPSWNAQGQLYFSPRMIQKDCTLPTQCFATGACRRIRISILAIGRKNTVGLGYIAVKGII